MLQSSTITIINQRNKIEAILWKLCNYFGKGFWREHLLRWRRGQKEDIHLERSLGFFFISGLLADIFFYFFFFLSHLFFWVFFLIVFEGSFYCYSWWVPSFTGPPRILFYMLPCPIIPCGKLILQLKERNKILLGPVSHSLNVEN